MEQVNNKLIERYFDGDLDEQELALVSQKLKDDPAFAEAFQLEEDLQAGITVAGNEALRQRLNVIHETVGTKKVADVMPMRSRRIWVWLAAATFIGVVVMAKVLWDGQAKTPAQLYAVYAVHEFDFTEKGGGEAELAKAEGLLKEKKYAEALPVLEGYLAEHPEEREVLLAKGVALMETGNLQQALEVFDALSNNPIMAPDMVWYKALILLKENKLAESLSLLKSVPPGSLRYSNAQALAVELSKIKQ
jgi:tetratricopeptide (TPR) repeat protein